MRRVAPLRGPAVVADPATQYAPTVPIPAVARIDFLNALRAAAVLLVLWDHMAAAFPVQSGFGYLPAAWAAKWVFVPLGITQDGGFLGVAIFFLVSGFIVTRVAEREDVVAFVVRRILRIFPPLAVAVLLSACWLYPGPVSWPEVLRNIALVNYVSVPQVVLVGVAWTLIIEVVFYLLVAVVVAWCRLPPYAVLAVELAVVAATRLTAGDFGPHWSLLSVSVAYVPLLLLGQVVHYRDRQQIGRIGAWSSGLVLFGFWEWSVTRIYPDFLAPPSSYPLSVVFALAVFLLALRAPAGFGGDRISRYLADRSYAVYLLHGLIGFWAMSWLHRHQVPFTLCLVGGLVVTLIGAELSWWLIERPSRRLAHRITRRRRGPGS